MGQRSHQEANGSNAKRNKFSNTIQFQPGSKEVNSIVKKCFPYILNTKKVKEKIILSTLLMIPHPRMKIAPMVLKT